MKKIASLLILATFLFSSVSVNAYFVNKSLGEKKTYYGIITGLLKKDVEGEIKTIYLLKDKYGRSEQLFSKKLEGKINRLFLNKNNVKIIGHPYRNIPNNIHAGIAVKDIINMDIIINNPKPIAKKPVAKKQKPKKSKALLKIEEIFSHFPEVNDTIKIFLSMDKNILKEINKNSGKENLLLLSNKNLSDSEKVLANTLKTIPLIENYFRFKIKLNEEKIFYKEVLKFLSKIKINNEYKENSTKQLNDFLKENDTLLISKESNSKDFQPKTVGGLNVDFPQNFDFQTIKVGQTVFNKFYFKDFYSNTLSFNVNEVKKFSKIVVSDDEFYKLNTLSVKIAGNYGKLIKTDKTAIYQITSKSGKKYEISYSTLDKNFEKIFKNILNKISNLNI